MNLLRCFPWVSPVFRSLVRGLRKHPGAGDSLEAGLGRGGEGMGGKGCSWRTLLLGILVLSLPHRGGSTSVQLFRSADGDRVRLPAILNSWLNPRSEGTWNPLRRLVSPLYPPCILSFRSLSLGSPAAPHRHGHQGRRAARMQISEGPSDAPPTGIKGGAGRAPDLRSRCLPGAGPALRRASCPVSPRVVHSSDSLPLLLVRTRSPAATRVRQGWGASCRGRNERGATSAPSVESVLPWVLVVQVCTF